MTGTVQYINHDTKKYAVRLKNGKCVVFKLNDSTNITVGDSIDFDRNFGAQPMYHILSGERFSASLEYMDIECSNIESYCK